MGRPRKYTDEQIIDALRETKGMVYLAAQNIGCEADTIYNRAKQCKEIAALIEEERGKVIDKAELKLFDAIQAGEPWAIRMVLATIGKHRGYVERQEVTGADGGSIGVAFTPTQIAQAGTLVEKFVASRKGEMPSVTTHEHNGHEPSAN
jgi:hypothetical protein